MAGNKYNPPNKPYKPYMYTLTYLNEYNAQETVQGTANQVMRHILNQQTV
tara:strand:+ start:684 stop:833 length:150 start_codon:yes stop_codon:yes gene_type:complete